MRPFILALIVAVFASAAVSVAQQPTYKVLRSARGGGEGGWDYIYADVGARRLYIPRRGPAPNAPAPPAGAPAPTARLSVYNLDTLDLLTEIDGIGGNGAAVDPKSGHGFTSSRPVSMFDTK